MVKDNSDKPELLAFSKKILPSDALMYGTSWDERYTKCKSIKIREKSVSGIMSDSEDVKRLTDKVVRNWKLVETAALKLMQDTLVFRFSVKFLPLAGIPVICPGSMEDRIMAVMKDFCHSNGLEELSYRYALNLVNGRFLWRNYVGAEQLEIRIQVDSGDTILSFNPDDYTMRNFDRDSNDTNLNALETEIRSALSGQKHHLLLRIEAYVQLGRGQTVYPSGGSRGGKLYSVGDTAAVHSQKIGNALRTIDTWYPGYGSLYSYPIAVEPFGTVPSRQLVLRPSGSGRDFYHLFGGWLQGNPPESPGDRNYVMAVLLRGGVFRRGDLV